MYFAQAVKGPKTRSFMLNTINSKAEVEVGHKLSTDEVSKLTQRFSIDYVFDATERVRLFDINSCV